MSVRRRVYIPKFEGAIEGYVVNFLSRNFWRVEGYIEREDLMQEARCLFYKLQRRYSYVDNPAWFMSLFKVAFSNEFHGLSNRRTERMSFEACSIDDVDSIMDWVSNEDNQGLVFVLVEQAPEEVRAVLSLLASAPMELLEEVAGAWKAQGRRKVEGNSHLCELLGYDPKETDLVQDVLDYFLNQ